MASFSQENGQFLLGVEDKEMEEQAARDEEIRVITENMDKEELDEYKDIFSFFDR